MRKTVAEFRYFERKIINSKMFRLKVNFQRRFSWQNIFHVNVLYVTPKAFKRSETNLNLKLKLPSASQCI